jgi:hypothetical protein
MVARPAQAGQPGFVRPLVDYPDVDCTLFNPAFLPFGSSSIRPSWVDLMYLDQPALLAEGIYVTRATPRERLAALAHRLHPVQTRFGLIRVGGPRDGGYLVPNDLAGIAACFSPGVGPVASFEEALLRDHGVPSLLADGSVAGPPPGFVPLSFIQRYLGPVDDAGSIRLDTWVRSWPGFSHGTDLLLQIDIEGAEYVTLLGVSEQLLARFRVIVLELHSIESWAHPDFMRIAEALLDRLLARFHLVHSHPNNCCGITNIDGVLAPRVLELTFLRKDRSPALGPCREFPHPLDAGNLADVADLPLPPGWLPDGIPGTRT